MKMKSLFIVFILCFSYVNANYIKTHNEDFITYKINAKYSDVLFTLEDEIAKNGFIISYRAKIAKALKKIDTHYKQNPIFRKAQKIGFCKLSLTLKMMQDNPDNLVYCPLSFAIYEKSNEKNNITLIYQLTKNLNQNSKVMSEVNKEIITMIEKVLEEI